GIAPSPTRERPARREGPRTLSTPAPVSPRPPQAPTPAAAPRRPPPRGHPPGHPPDDLRYKAGRPLDFVKAVHKGTDEVVYSLGDFATRFRPDRNQAPGRGCLALWECGGLPPLWIFPLPCQKKKNQSGDTRRTPRNFGVRRVSRFGFISRKTQSG